MGHYCIFEIQTEEDFEESGCHLFYEDYEALPPISISGLCDYYNVDTSDKERENSLASFKERYQTNWGALKSLEDVLGGIESEDKFSRFLVDESFLKYFKAEMERTQVEVGEVLADPSRSVQERLDDIRFKLEDYHGHRFFLPSISRNEVFNELEILDFLEDNLGSYLYIGATADYHA